MSIEDFIITVFCIKEHLHLLWSLLGLEFLLWFEIFSASRRERGPALCASRAGNERASSPRPQIAKQNRIEGGGTVLCTDRLQRCDLAKRDEAQGGRGGCGVSAHNPTCL